LGKLTSHAKFQEANFSDTEFQGGAYFYGAKFQGISYFSNAEFHGEASFVQANFQGEAVFSEVRFQGEASFSRSDFYNKTYFSGHFNGRTKFNYVLFEGKEKVIFDIENLSNVSFMNTDITGVRFSDEARWGGGEKAKEDRFKIVDERLLEEKFKEKYFNLGSIKAVYRNLRENYEYRMRYDEAGQFFIREMELKRMYREDPSISIFKQRMYKLLRWLKLRNRPQLGTILELILARVVYSLKVGIKTKGMCSRCWYSVS
jgi:hypothetical protein